MSDENTPHNFPGGPTFTQRVWSSEVAIANAEAGEPVELQETAYQFSNGRQFKEPKTLG